MKSAQAFNSFDELPAILQADHIISVTGLSRAKIYGDLFKQPGFPVITCGRRKIVPKEAFLRWLERQMGNNE
jgi:hypothetical protein